MEAVHKRFRNLQKDSIEAFLGAFSERINAIFQFLNPTVKIENIRLVSIEANDELSGITIEMDFWNKKRVSPPHKYLSESYQNCVGISFFLASVEAFNSQNKFIVFDDVISSFDANHRKRFAELLVEQYEEKYQLILMTHEETWFEWVRHLVKNKDWLLKEIKYNESAGTYMDKPAKDLRERIEFKIESSDKENLGNDARKYLEAILKNIVWNLEVKLPFRFNSDNEDRTVYELLTEIKGTLKKRNCSELLGNDVIDRLLGSTFIGNKDSHDSSYSPSLLDLKAFWRDICDFEGLFICSTCGSYISHKYYDNVEKKIRCRKGEISYSWNK
jgi:energy-coupling factor transporter ATP-binding protein EcfA2